MLLDSPLAELSILHHLLCQKLLTELQAQKLLQVYQISFYLLPFRIIPLEDGLELEDYRGRVRGLPPTLPTLSTTHSLSMVFLFHMVIKGRVREIGLATPLRTKLTDEGSLAVLLGLLESSTLTLIVLADGLALAEAGFVL